MIKKDYKRGQLAKEAGCNIETVRYYEKEGLLPDPPRSDKGYRLYQTEDLKRLSFIIRCRDLGFSIVEIRELLSLVDKHNYTCADINEITRTHIENVQRKITDLNNILTTLQDMAHKCDAGNSPDCPILDTLFENT